MRNNNLGIALLLFITGVIQYNCSSSKTAQTATKATYREQHRPQYHFSPARQWMNDPNGLVFYEGEYHLFYQFYPDSNVWGPMHWAHSISTDLVHWKHLPIALYPDSVGYIFSGSAVVDWKNTTGFGKNGKPPLVAMFTYHNMDMEKAGRKDCETQGIAYSNDRGRTWTKYAGNPVIPNPGNQKDFRDPKLVWYEATKQWVVGLAVADHTEFWGSADLKHWTHLSDFGREFGAHDGVWECPDLFQMPVTSETGEILTGQKKWVLIQNLNPGGPLGGSGTQYFVGDFDGKNFVIDPAFAKSVPKGKGVWLDGGKDNYAGITWSDVPESDGRRVFIGWMSNWEYSQVVPTYIWRNAMTLPRALTLRKTTEGYRVHSQPVKELEQLRSASFELPATQLNNSRDVTGSLGFPPTQSEWMLDFDLQNATATHFGVELTNSTGEVYRLGYNVVTKQYFSDRTKAGKHTFSDKFANSIHLAPRASTDKTVRMHLFFDVSSMELFADGGSTAMTELYFPTTPFTSAKVFVEGGKVLANAKIYQIKGIWK